jgi:hypothetical protein
LFNAAEKRTRAAAEALHGEKIAVIESVVADTEFDPDQAVAKWSSAAGSEAAEGGRNFVLGDVLSAVGEEIGLVHLLELQLAHGAGHFVFHGARDDVIVLGLRKRLRQRCGKKRDQEPLPSH